MKIQAEHIITIFGRQICQKRLKLQIGEYTTIISLRLEFYALEESVIRRCVRDAGREQRLWNM